MSSSFECAHEDCAFAVRAADADTVVAMARKHERDRHGDPPADGDLQGRVESV